MNHSSEDKKDLYLNQLLDDCTNLHHQIGGLACAPVCEDSFCECFVLVPGYIKAYAG